MKKIPYLLALFVVVAGFASCAPRPTIHASTGAPHIGLMPTMEKLAE